jgi:DNA-binding transcriptional MocR family regulator
LQAVCGSGPKDGSGSRLPVSTISTSSAEASSESEATSTRPDGGFFISLTLPEGVSATDVRTQAATRALNLADGLAFFPNGGGDRFVRLPFCALTPAEIDEGVRRLAESVTAAREVQRV